MAKQRERFQLTHWITATVTQNVVRLSLPNLIQSTTGIGTSDLWRSGMKVKYVTTRPPSPPVLCFIS